MKTCICTLQSTSPYSQSKFIDPSLKKDKETNDVFEKRMWPEKMHYNENNEVYIPPMAFKQSIDEAARYLSIQVPGRGKTTYTKHFKSGVLCTTPVLLGIKKGDVKGEQFLMNSDGVRGSGKRVPRTFPVVPKWTSTVEFAILDELVTEDVFIRVLHEAGQVIGVGRFRPQNGGYYGRFSLVDYEWIEKESAQAA